MSLKTNEKPDYFNLIKDDNESSKDGYFRWLEFILASVQKSAKINPVVLHSYPETLKEAIEQARIEYFDYHREYDEYKRTKALEDHHKQQEASEYQNNLDEYLD